MQNLDKDIQSANLGQIGNRVEVSKQSLGAVLVEPIDGRVELFVRKILILGAEDKLEGGKGVVGPGQGKHLLQIFKAGVSNCGKCSEGVGKEIKARVAGGGGD